MSKTESYLLKRTFSISPEMERTIDTILQEKFGLSLKDHKKIADCIVKLSDHFNQKNPGPTPWKQDWCKIAYLTYYSPLNELRMLSVLQECQRVGFFATEETILDFGSGLGSSGNALAQLLSLKKDLQFKLRLLELEPNDLARNFLQEIRAAQSKQMDQAILLNRGYSTATVTTADIEKLATGPHKPTTLILSYSLVESHQLPAIAESVDRLIILEPSTGDRGRKLMELRAQWIKKGYRAWAPCTHQEACPLLVHSQRDWCHDRIHFNRPTWFASIEKYLPMKNATLTFSYLALGKLPKEDSESAAAYQNRARVVGDLLPEKGKDRQLICRDSERVFLTWMHRDWEGQPTRIEIPRGSLIEAPDVDQKSDELRVRTPIQIISE